MRRTSGPFSASAQGDVYKRQYQGLVRYWLTFNEINSVALSYLNAGVTLEDERDRAAVTAAFSHHKMCIRDRPTAMARRSA